jgi:hypothetical protein
MANGILKYIFPSQQKMVDAPSGSQVSSRKRLGVLHVFGSVDRKAAWFDRVLHRYLTF